MRLSGSAPSLLASLLLILSAVSAWSQATDRGIYVAPEDDLVIRAPNFGRPAPDAGHRSYPDDDYVWHVQGLRPGDVLPLRSGAGPRFRVIGHLEEGMPIENLGCMDQNGGFWCRVATVGRPRISGWVNGRYISDEAGGETRDRMMQGEVFVPGTRYNDIGPLSCRFRGDDRVAACNYGIARNGTSAQIDITTPYGDTRSLQYRAGRFSSIDGSEVRSRKQGGNAEVTINGEETYYIPDNVILDF